MKPNYQTTLNITEEENNIVEILKAKGIKIISIWRRGLDAYEKELIDSGELNKTV